MVQLIVLLLCACCALSQHVHYMRPNDSSNQHCPAAACPTLDEYVQQANANLTTGTTVIFLGGIHHLNKRLDLINVTNITLQSDESARIICRNEGSIFCRNVTSITVQKLNFILEFTNNRHPSFFNFLDASRVKKLNLTFEGNANLDRPFTAISSNNSIITIERCHFERNAARNGGAMYLTGSTLTLDGSTFRDNRATYNGGAIAALESVVILKAHLGNIFIHNIASEYHGGAIYGDNVILRIEGSAPSLQPLNETTESLRSGVVFFSHNRARYGGGICLIRSKATLEGTNIVFTNNSAVNGGGISFMKSAAIVKSGHLSFSGNAADSVGGGIHVSGFEGFLILGEDDREIWEIIASKNTNLSTNCTESLADEDAPGLNFTEILQDSQESMVFTNNKALVEP